MDIQSTNGNFGPVARSRPLQMDLKTVEGIG